MRRKPITRGEVRIDYWRQIETVPADSVRVDSERYKIEAIEHLWKPLIAELVKEWAVMDAR